MNGSLLTALALVVVQSAAADAISGSVEFRSDKASFALDCELEFVVSAHTDDAYGLVCEDPQNQLEADILTGVSQQFQITDTTDGDVYLWRCATPGRFTLSGHEFSALVDCRSADGKVLGDGSVRRPKADLAVALTENNPATCTLGGLIKNVGLSEMESVDIRIQGSHQILFPQGMPKECAAAGFNTVDCTGITLAAGEAYAVDYQLATRSSGESTIELLGSFPGDVRSLNDADAMKCRTVR